MDRPLSNVDANTLSTNGQGDVSAANTESEPMHRRQRSSVVFKKSASSTGAEESAGGTTSSSFEYDSLRLSKYDDGYGAASSDVQSIDIDHNLSSTTGHEMSWDSGTPSSEPGVHNTSGDEKSTSASATHQEAPNAAHKHISKASSSDNEGPGTAASDAERSTSSARDVDNKNMSTSGFSKPTLSRGNSFSQSQVTASGGPRKLSLLSGTSVLNSASASASRSVSPTLSTSSHAATLRAGKPTHRLSVAYNTSTPDRSASPGTSPVLSANGFGLQTQMSSAGTGSASVGEDGLKPLAMSRSASTSTRLSDVSVQDDTSLKRTNEGDTIVTQHQNVLRRIAEKERRILELKDQLAREEGELKALRSQWQTSANKELSGSGIQTALQRGGRTSGGSAASDTASLSNTEAGETLRNLSARFQSGLGSLLEQLGQHDASLNQAEEQQGSRATSSSNITPLGSVVEENVMNGTNSGESPTRCRTSNVTAAPQRTKRNSILGGSLAALQKQLELPGPNTAERPRMERSSSTGGEGVKASTGSWLSWQKHLKDARENASNLLALAEERIGQAMAVDEVSMQRDAARAEAKPAVPAKDFGAAAKQPNTFQSENDREKAALAELSWLNSLMGIQTNGSVDRATAITEQTDTEGDQQTPMLDGKDESTETMEAQDEHRSYQRRGSSATRRTSLASSGGQDKNARRVASNGSDASSQSSSSAAKRVSGIFTALSAMFEPEAEQPSTDASSHSPPPPNTHRTRVAARAAAFEQKNESLDAEQSLK